MAYMSEEEKERMRQNGRSEHEIAYYEAEGQKEYEPLLRDPTTPADLIDRIVDSLTLVPLKILAFKHPNVTVRSQRYMLKKADKKSYQKQLIEAYISNEKTIVSTAWIRIRNSVITTNRFDLAVIELLEEQSEVFTESNLHVIFNAFAHFGTKFVLFERFILAIFEHKNFTVRVVDGDLFRQVYIFNKTPVLNAINATKNKGIICNKIYEITGDVNWLPQEAKDIFLF